MTSTDIIASVALIGGAGLSMLAGIAVLRFPDVMSRIHAATKPQVLGIILMMLGVGLRIGSPAVIGVLVLIVVLQFVTAPISAHLVVRAAYRRHRAPDKPAGAVGLAGSDLHETEHGSDSGLPGESADSTGSPTAAKAGTASATTGYGPTVADIGIEDAADGGQNTITRIAETGIGRRASESDRPETQQTDAEQTETQQTDVPQTDAQQTHAQKTDAQKTDN